MKEYNLVNALKKPESITELYIHNRNLEAIPDSVRQLKHLKVLGLRQNKLATLPVWLNDLKYLEKLDLSSNRFHTFPKSIFLVEKIKSLNFGNNFIQRIPEKINTLKKLESIDFSNNQIRSIPDDFSFSFLKELKLNNNRISTLPMQFGHLPQLIYLDLSFNKLVILPSGIIQCKSLQVLKLDRNKLEVLEEPVTELSFLQKLSLTNNRLKKTSIQIGQLHLLRSLELSGNKIEELPEQIGQLKWLSQLLLRKNKIKKLPLSIGEVSRLQYLDVEHNQINWLPDTLNALPDLEVLLLRGNPIQNEKKYFLKFPKIKQLTGLGNIFSATEKRQLLSFLKQAKKQGLNENERLNIYDLSTKNKALPKLFLIKAMNFPDKKIRERALDQFIERFNAKKAMDKNQSVAILGKTGLKFKELKKQLERIQVKLKTGIDEEVKHIVLGAFPGNQLQLEKRAFTFWDEHGFRQFLNSKNIMDHQTISDTASDNLSRLLLSRQESNLALAIQILQNIKPSTKLITDIFIAYKYTGKAIYKRSLKQILNTHASKRLVKKLSFRLSFGNAETLRTNIMTYAEGTELDAERVLHFFSNS